jgi:hypothetical protein
VKNNLFPAFSILALVILFSMAATCNLCGVNLSTEAAASSAAAPELTSTSIEAAEQTKTVAEGTNENTVKDTAGDNTTEANEIGSTEPTTTSTSGPQDTAPTIKLQIYEGPSYSQADDVCYYRIEAIVSGSPAPAVTFSRDDSKGSFGSKKVQVNLTKNSQSYQLTAKAKNPAGEASASIDLKWGCSQPQPVEKTIDILPSDYGTVTEFKGFPGGVFVGYFQDHDERGRFAFDLSLLAGKEITYAQIKLINPTYSTALCNFMGDIAIFYNDFLPGITKEDYFTNNTYGSPAIFSWKADPLQFSDDFLKNKVQERAASGTKLQFGIGFTKPAAAGSLNLLAIRTYYKEDIILTVTYKE